MRRRTPEKPRSYVGACPSASNNSMRPAWQTRSQFPSPCYDHSRHDFSEFNITAFGNSVLWALKKQKNKCNKLNAVAQQCNLITNWQLVAFLLS